MLNVCVPVLNRYDLLRKLLESLRASTVPVDNIYVMNNGMDRAKAEALVGIVSNTVVLNPDRPLGVAESWNWFIQNVPEERIITNDDIEFAPDSLAQMLAHTEAFVSCGYGFSCFLLRDACVDTVGMFDEAISPGYGYFEDMDYLRLMKLAGIRDHVVNCGVVHHQSQTPAAFTRQQRIEHDVRFTLAMRNYAAKWKEEPDWSQLRTLGGQGKTKGITFIVATTGRPSLRYTLASIEAWPGDEILVVGSMGDATDPRVRFIPHTPGGDWGHTERNVAMTLAKGQYLAHIDDDDIYVPGARALMFDALEKTPDAPTLFRMRFPNGLTLWNTQEFKCGNMGTPCFLHPNVPEKLGRWASYVGGDFAFLESCGWKPEEYAWRPEIVALLGHNI